jgi:putative membrane protein
MMQGHAMMAGGGWLWMVLVGLFWLALVALSIWGLSRLFPLRRSESSSEKAPSAIELLKQRYARGEINRTEYEEARSVLE